ncbi:Putative cheY-homologous receiver domain containing Serine/Threonine protein kinase [Klebsormidium nitens]|uniref:non-specific serine/threonine protein kinase n=1 Tax=Klebsormidium nitens TaxID=105231 RepID=A0A1Y1ITE9_KLENI|nr:Putative cheY-homologous receiver domain containing Serine/Threonine protein kinase [Klebsormidium nitens]|eukprot:GAQ93352.1 Putative cheY-homologous receiver domain containing Serine/Threonine protein kinase [Klebsormidium nitens]
MQRYSKSDHILGSSEFKTFYSGFDHKQGVAVAWSVIDLKSGECTDQLVRTLQLIQRVEHDHIVRIHDWFLDPDSGKMHVVTDLFRPGNLRDLLKAAGRIDEIVLRRWGCDLLTAISFVHSLDGPLRIRNLRMGNVLVHQDVGVIKLDLLSVSFLFTSHGYARERVEAIRVMSPECLLGPTDEKVDIYGFGMVMLEAATRLQPYKECSTVASLYDKVTHFQPPKALGQVQDKGLQDIIKRTLLRASERPSAHDLLNLPYFRFEPSLWGMHVVVIDDDPVNLRMCTRLLEKEGVTVVPCNTFNEVITLLSTRAFAALITDIVMPNMGGFEMSASLRQLRYNSLMIIGISAHKREDLDERMAESGMDAFLLLRRQQRSKGQAIGASGMVVFGAFWRATGCGASAAFHEFSNFYTSNLQYHHVEGFFQAAKFQGTDPEYFERVRLTSWPRSAKALGRRRRMTAEQLKAWEARKDGVMATVLRAKFEQHPQLRELLLSDRRQSTGREAGTRR